MLMCPLLRPLSIQWSARCRRGTDAHVGDSFWPGICLYVGISQTEIMLGLQYMFYVIRFTIWVIMYATNGHKHLSLAKHIRLSFYRPSVPSVLYSLIPPSIHSLFSPSFLTSFFPYSRLTALRVFLHIFLSSLLLPFLCSFLLLSLFDPIVTARKRIAHDRVSSHEVTRIHKWTEAIRSDLEQHGVNWSNMEWIGATWS